MAGLVAALLVSGCTAASEPTPSVVPSATALVSSASPFATASPAASIATPTPTPVGSWTATGSLHTARYGQTATLLLDGRVLIVGGSTSNMDMQSGLASAELYDPSTHAWTATGSMASPRIYHTATLLLDGRVLVAGGNQSDVVAGCDVPSCSNQLGTAEIYDPATGRWSATGKLLATRGGHTATRLPDGRVLVAGGLGGGTLTHFADVLRSAEIYDPATGRWSATGAMAVAREGHGATTLSDGSVLVVGGFGELGIVDSAERYDPSAGMWATAGTLPNGALGTATLLRDGRVLYAGGDTGLEQPASAVLFDPNRVAWSTTGPMLTARERHVTALLLDGCVLAAGGWTIQQTSNGQTPNGDLASSEVFDPDTGTWTATADLHLARASATGTSLADGTVLVVGGDVGGGNTEPTASVEIFNPGC